MALDAGDPRPRGRGVAGSSGIRHPALGATRRRTHGFRVFQCTQQETRATSFVFRAFPNASPSTSTETHELRAFLRMLDSDAGRAQAPGSLRPAPSSLVVAFEAEFERRTTGPDFAWHDRLSFPCATDREDAATPVRRSPDALACRPGGTGRIHRVVQMSGPRKRVKPSRRVGPALTQAGIARCPRSLQTPLVYASDDVRSARICGLPGSR